MILSSVMLALLLVKLSESSTYLQDDSNECMRCPLWTKPVIDKQHSNCECGARIHGIVNCDNITLKTAILPCYCLSFSKDLNTTILGGCIYSCKFTRNRNIFYAIPAENIDMLCEKLHRTGQMCGSCVEGYAPPVYSYNLACVECSDYKYNWLKYIAVAYLPLTVFFFIVIFFRVSVTSPSMNMYILVSQIVGIPPLSQSLSSMRFNHNTKQTLAYKLPLVSMYGIWNLDFFRAAYKPFCLHPNMTTLQAISLDYIIAVYPLCLIVITYILVELHDHYRVVVWLWTPFRRCFINFRREWDLSNSLIGAFATFLLLSYVKILYVSFTLLMPNVLHDINGQTLKKHYLYYDGNTEWFGKEHLPYAIIALTLCSLLNIFPLLLLFLYPCRCFQRCLSHCGHRFQTTLKIFMDTFQGCYKTSPRDCRYFSGVYPLLRFLMIIQFPFVTFFYHYFEVMAFLLFVTILFLLVVRPYAKNCYNVIDTAMLSMMVYSLLTYNTQAVLMAMKVKTPDWKIIQSLLGTAIYVPHFYGLLILGHKLLPQKPIQKILVKFRMKTVTSDLFPHRMEYSCNEYTPIP